jgi:hypothetical protein
MALIKVEYNIKLLHNTPTFLIKVKTEPIARFELTSSILEIAVIPLYYTG